MREKASSVMGRFYLRKALTSPSGLRKYVAMQETNASTLPRCIPWALDRVEAGEPVTVTRGRTDEGFPRRVAVLVPWNFYKLAGEAMDAILNADEIVGADAQGDAL